MTEPINAIFEDKIRINSYDCDINGNWKPAAFFQHLTEAAHKHASQLGVGYPKMIQQKLELGSHAFKDQIPAFSAN